MYRYSSGVNRRTKLHFKSSIPPKAITLSRISPDRSVTPDMAPDIAETNENNYVQAVSDPKLCRKKQETAAVILT